jgi:manganese/zinc/iron transport system substrate-binding protein
MRRVRANQYRSWTAGAAGLSLLAAAACAPPAPADTDGRLYAVATVGMVADVVRNVGGERVRVDALMGPGVDPHLYKASEGDVRRLFRADVVFYVGLHLEARMAEVLDEMGTRVRTVAVGQAVPVEHLQRPPEFAGAYDPHVWFDVALWRYTVDGVARGLADADPAHAAEYHANAERYSAKLDTLDDYVRARAAELPPERRVLVTAHDAFGYFGRAYGFEVHGLQGISTAAEAGTHDVQALAAMIAERRIPAVFVESSVPRRTIEAVQEAVRARGFTVRIGGDLFSDAMGSPGTPEGTYLGMVKHNVDTIVDALARDPEDG